MYLPQGLMTGQSCCPRLIGGRIARGVLVEDETGATFWPTNAGACFNATNARFRVAGVDLSVYASADNRYKLVAKDSALKKAEGYIDLADSAEALGSALNISDCVNGSYDTFDGISATGFHAISDGTGDAQTATADELSVSTGKLYRVGLTLSLSSGTAARVTIKESIGDAVLNTFAVEGTLTTGNYTWDFVSTSTEDVVVQFRNSNGNASEYTISNLSLKEVTHVGTDGVLIMSTKGGTTQSWALQESGIDLNDIASFSVSTT